ncbi:hypothetical protein GCM10010269_71300 [Streptomyces humidus]|uniref:Uncharacterized protein n=1 Tax=Streptomyces humidus TaxID=52259 RepID=A0A918G7H2_9ACTN|nr:hypothetical protein GCM10010269_71300 [Streptomyces humidus]
MTAVASGLQVVKRVRVGMRGTVLASTPVQKRADDARVSAGRAVAGTRPSGGSLPTAERRSCDGTGR